MQEAAAKAAQAQALLAGEAESAAQERVEQLAADCQRLELAAATQQSEREQLAGELQCLAASETAARAELQAAAAAAAQQAAALSRLQHELEVAQAQLQARSVGSKDGRRHRWARVGMGLGEASWGASMPPGKGVPMQLGGLAHHAYFAAVYLPCGSLIIASPTSAALPAAAAPRRWPPRCASSRPPAAR